MVSINNNKRITKTLKAPHTTKYMAHNNHSFLVFRLKKKIPPE